MLKQPSCFTFDLVRFWVCVKDCHWFWTYVLVYFTRQLISSFGVPLDIVNARVYYF